MRTHKSVSHQFDRVTGDFRIGSLGSWRYVLWLALLVASSVAFTFGLACAVPFAAYGAVAALTMRRRDALLLVTTVWLANQLIGFTILDYPWTANTVAWGFALGMVALLATLASQWSIQLLNGPNRLAVLLAAFVTAFVAYEGGLLIVAATMLGGTEDFTSAIVTRILEINAAAYVGLLVLDQLAFAGGLAVTPGRRLPVTELHPLH